MALLALGGRAIDAATALRWGLVDEVTEPNGDPGESGRQEPRRPGGSGVISALRTRRRSLPVSL